VPSLKEAVHVYDTDAGSTEEGLRSLWLATLAASVLWDHRGWEKLGSRHVKLARDYGALNSLPLALDTRVFVDLFAGDLDAASALVEEIRTVTEVSGTAVTSYGAIGLAAFRGHVDEAAPLIAIAMENIAARGEGIGVALTHWAQALLCNAVGRYSSAFEAARVAAACPQEVGVSNWGLIELVEAAARSGQSAAGDAALEELSAMTRSAGTDWALGVQARSEALLRVGDQAESLYREAVERLQKTPMAVELARAELVFGEWLRRAGRRVEAREQLRTAHAALTAMGMEAFAERARRELAATGATVRKRTEDSRRDLTAQELQIARLAADGLTNAEIGAELFISPRTVEWHLGKVFTKLEITGRSRLLKALPITVS
jgi:DNA-binding CsgD family transcriptional regulator